MIGSYTPTLSPIYGWTFVHAGTGLKDATDTAARSCEITPFNGKLYVVWAAGTSSLGPRRIYVSEYDPSNGTWTRIDPGSGVGLNFASAQDAQTPNLCVFSGKLYCTWQENVGGASPRVRVKVWSGTGTSWTFVDGNTTAGLNKSTSRSSSHCRLVVLSNKLYVCWAEAANAGGNTDRQIRCRVYNGNDLSPTWTFVDGNAATGLNKLVTEHSDQPVPIVFSSKLYLFWIENNTSAVSQLRVRVYNGNDGSPVWTFVDGNGANGINANTANSAGSSGSIASRHVTAFVYAGSLYVLWDESGKPHMKVYNGNDGAPTWTAVDGGTSNGLIYNTAASSDTVAAVVPDTWAPHLSWFESGSVEKVSVYNGVTSSPTRRNLDTANQLTLGFYNSLAFEGTVYLCYLASSTSGIQVARGNVT